MASIPELASPWYLTEERSEALTTRMAELIQRVFDESDAWYCECVEVAWGVS